MSLHHTSQLAQPHVSMLQTGRGLEWVHNSSPIVVNSAGYGVEHISATIQVGEQLDRMVLVGLTGTA